MRVLFRPGRQVSSDRSAVTCSCAERTGELVIFTCPVCCSRALEQLRGLTTRGIEIRLDEEGSVSASIGSGRLHGQK